MAKSFYICKVCGDIHYGMKWPEICPTCQTKNAYEAIEKDAAKKQMGL
ncbi:MAG TPA: hypothetical protein VJI75_02990 [Candidatus Nanoarchaeia archaeon]|nr:hypothetical protein [Candidatus Nanoarchaeia archaeon]